MDEGAIAAQLLEGPDCEINEDDEKMLNDDRPNYEADEDLSTHHQVYSEEEVSEGPENVNSPNNSNAEVTETYEVVPSPPNLFSDRAALKASIVKKRQNAQHRLQSELEPTNSSEKVAEVSEKERNQTDVANDEFLQDYKEPENYFTGEQNNRSIPEEDDQLILTTEAEEERFFNDEEEETDQQTGENSNASPNRVADSGKPHSNSSKSQLNLINLSSRRIASKRGRARPRNLVSTVRAFEGTNKVNQKLFRDKIIGTNQPDKSIFTEFAHHELPALQAVRPQAATNYSGPALQAACGQTAANNIRSNFRNSSHQAEPHNYQPNMLITRGRSLPLSQSSLYISKSAEKIAVDLNAKPTAELGEFFVIDKDPRDLYLFQNRQLPEPANPFRSNSNENLYHDERSLNVEQKKVRRNSDTRLPMPTEADLIHQSSNALPPSQCYQNNIESQETNSSNEHHVENDIKMAKDESDDECQAVLSVIGGKAFVEVKDFPQLTIKNEEIEVIEVDSSDDEDLAAITPRAMLNESKPVLSPTPDLKPEHDGGPEPYFVEEFEEEEDEIDPEKIPLLNAGFYTNRRATNDIIQEQSNKALEEIDTSKPIIPPEILKGNINCPKFKKLLRCSPLQHANSKYPAALKRLAPFSDHLSPEKRIRPRSDSNEEDLRNRLARKMPHLYAVILENLPDKLNGDQELVKLLAAGSGVIHEITFVEDAKAVEIVFKNKDEANNFYLAKNEQSYEGTILKCQPPVLLK